MGFLSNLSFRKRGQSEPGTSPAAPATAPTPAAPAPVVEVEAEGKIEVAVDSLPEPDSAPAAPPAPADNSQARAQAEELVRSVVGELPDFLTVAVIDRNSGQILAGQWAGHSGGAVEAAAADAEIVRQTHQAIEALQLGPEEQFEDMLITLRRQWHLLQVLPQQQWLLYLALRTQDTNPGLARTVLRNYIS